MEKVLEAKNSLINEKYELLEKLKTIENKIKECDDYIGKQCNHEWITEREDGIYGDRFTVCKLCKINRGF